MADISIGEAARRTGVRTSTLRFYEEAGIIPPARRVNGRRVYDDEGLDLIQVARFAQGVGFSLAEVRDLFRGLDARSGLGAHWRPRARAKLKELDAVIAKATQMKAAIEYGLACGCIRIEDCLPGKAARAEPAAGRKRR
jgi:MerR family redox-sensitive transcriptional activator SoxR